MLKSFDTDWRALHFLNGLLAIAGYPRLAPALAALFNEPARPWSRKLNKALQEI
jgi:hypothetical protein